jgi:hypothetical protein
MVARSELDIPLPRKIQHPTFAGLRPIGSSPILFLTMPFLPGEIPAARLARAAE